MVVSDKMTDMKYPLIILFLAGASALFGQDSELLNLIQKNAIRMDSLEKSNAAWRMKVDSLEKKYPSQIIALHAKVDSLDLVIDQLNKSSQSDKSKIQQLKKENAAKSDSIGQIVQMMGNRLSRPYRLPLDSLIGSHDWLNLQRDKELVTDAHSSVKIDALVAYHKARLTFRDRYSEARVNDALLLLKNLEQTPRILELQKNLTNYKLLSEKLRTKVSEIIQIDAKMAAAGDPEYQVDKLGKVLVPLGWFIRNYKFSFQEYPYLGSLIMEIINRKEVDADADIRDILSKI